MATYPIVLSVSGYVPQTPTALQQQLLAGVAATNPGYTANLPAILIEDISSTDVFSALQLDSSIAEIINSISPYAANAFLLNMIGNQTGVLSQNETNTSVYLLFGGASPGFVIAQGFTVSDGTYQYIVVDGGIIEASGYSNLLYALATVPGSWAVPVNTVTQIITSVDSSISPPLTVTNPQAGLPSIVAQSETDYRARVLQANLALTMGAPSFLKTQLNNIQGVQPRLVAVRQINTSPSQWEVICGGGDQYAVANAIFTSMFDFGNIVGSVLMVSGITNANPGVVSTNLNHGYATGQVVVISGATGITGINGVNLTITVVTEKTFSIGIDTTSSGSYTGNGVLSPNFRNIVTSIYDFPDTYSITFVNPPQQVVTMSITWNTNSTTYISPAAVAQAVAPAIAAYVNGISAGQPMNLFELNTTFQVAVANILPAQNLTRMVFSVNVNGIGVSPSSGTGIIAGDPESYFYTTSNSINVIQG